MVARMSLNIMLNLRGLSFVYKRYALLPSERLAVCPTAADSITETWVVDISSVIPFVIKKQTNLNK
jgi:hypothetical protein